jgi:hypothetical protein
MSSGALVGFDAQGHNLPVFTKGGVEYHPGDRGYEEIAKERRIAEQVAKAGKQYGIRVHNPLKYPVRVEVLSPPTVCRRRRIYILKGGETFFIPVEPGHYSIKTFIFKYDETGSEVTIGEGDWKQTKHEEITVLEQAPVEQEAVPAIRSLGDRLREMAEEEKNHGKR